MKTIHKIINETLTTFGILIAVFAILTFFVGEEAAGVSSLFESGNLAVPVKSIFQLLILSFLTTIIKNIMYSNYMIKKIPSIFRHIILFILCFIVLVIMILACRWFPSDIKLPWFLTAVAFILSFSSSLVITTIIEKNDNQKMNDALKRYSAN